MSLLRRLRERETFTVALSIIAVFAVTLHWVHPGRVIGQIDFFPNIAPFTLLAKSLWAWGTFLDANGSFQSPAFVPFYLVTGTLNAIFGASFGQGVYAGLILTAAWLGSWRLVRSYGFSVVGSALAAWAYVFNPYDTYFTLTFITATVFAAVLPWLLLLVRRASQSKHFAWRETAWCVSIAAVVFPVIAGTPQLMAELVFALAIWALYCTVTSPERSSFGRWTLVSSAICVACSLWWFVPIAFTFLLNHVVHPIAASQNAWVYARASLLNVMRFNPGWTWAYPEYYPYAAWLDSNAALYAAQFTIFALTLLGLITAKGERVRHVRFWVAVLMAALFITKGLHAPLAAVNVKIIATPPFFLLLEPAGAMLFGILTASLSIALAVDNIGAVASTRLSRAVVPTLAAVGIILGSYPTILGTLFHGSTPASMSMYVDIPRDWRDLGAYLRHADNHAAVLVTPTNATYQQKYVWGYSGIDLIAHMLLPNPVLILGAPITYVQEARSASLNLLIRRSLTSGSSMTIPLLRDLGVRYVVFRRDLVGAADPSIYRVARALKGARRSTFGSLELFDLGNMSSFSASTAYIMTMGEGVDPSPEAAVRARYEMLPRVPESSMRHTGLRPTLVERQLRTTNASSRMVPDRVIFTPESTGLQSSVRPLNNAVTKGIFLDVVAPRLTFAIPTSRLARAPIGLGAKAYPLLTSVDQDAHAWTLRVMNPSFQPMRTDLLLSVQVPNGARFVLKGALASYSSIAPPYRSTQLLRFKSVILPPGFSTLKLAQTTVQQTKLAPVVAPVRRVGLAYFRNVSQLGRGTSPAVLDARQRHIVMTLTHPLTLAAALPIDGIPLGDDPVVQVAIGQYTLGYNPGILIDVLSHGLSSVCYVPVIANAPVDIVARLHECARQNGLIIDDTSRIQSAVLHIALPPDWTVSRGASAVLGVIGWKTNPQTYSAVGLQNAGPTALLQITAAAIGAESASASITYSDAANAIHTERIPLVPIDAGNFILHATVRTLLPAAHRLRAIRVAVAAPPKSKASDVVSVSAPAPPLAIRATRGKITIVSASPRLVAGLHGRGPLPERECYLPGTFSQFYSATVQVRNAEAHILSVNQYYNPLWTALMKTRRGWTIPKHVQVDGWKNGWIIRGTGDVIIFNWANVIQAFLMAVSLCIMTQTWKRSLCAGPSL